MRTKNLILTLTILAFSILEINSQEIQDSSEASIDTSYFIAGDDEYNLFAAAERGDSAVVKILLKRDVDVNAQDWDNVTALMYASGQGHIGVVSILLFYGAEVNLKPDNKMTALLSAAKFDHTDVLDLLIQNGANLNDQDETGSTALMYAAAYNYFIVADMLLFYGADTEIKDKAGNTALMVACHAGNNEIADLLLENLADPEYVNNEGYTPLILASSKGFEDIVQTLIEYGVNLDASTEDGITALAMAAKNGHNKIVEKLLYYGADPEPSEEPTVNPLALAKKYKHFEIETMLKEAGAKSVNDRININRMGLAFDMNWNTTDFMYGGRFDIQNDRFGLDISAGYLTRAGNKRVLVEKGEHTYYQLFEKRSLVNLGMSKRIKLGKTALGGTQGIFIGANGLYSYGKYRGVPFKPDDLILFAPELGYYSLGKHTSMKISYEYLNFDEYKVSPHRINISFSIQINIKKEEVSDYKIKWLD
ncbi:MAG: ankyrin repeat domain-containing protein [Bacteroidales bacterium]|nr:ankyrin repeat domain-containing protein [Bacteroidales bacterium]